MYIAKHVTPYNDVNQQTFRFAFVTTASYPDVIIDFNDDVNATVIFKKIKDVPQLAASRDNTVAAMHSAYSMFSSQKEKNSQKETGVRKILLMIADDWPEQSRDLEMQVRALVDLQVSVLLITQDPISRDLSYLTGGHQGNAYAYEEADKLKERITRSSKHGTCLQLNGGEEFPLRKFFTFPFSGFFLYPGQFFAKQ